MYRYITIYITYPVLHRSLSLHRSSEADWYNMSFIRVSTLIDNIDQRVCGVCNRECILTTEHECIDGILDHLSKTIGDQLHRQSINGLTCFNFLVGFMHQ
jgi:hypothetical protein